MQPWRAAVIFLMGSIPEEGGIQLEIFKGNVVCPVCDGNGLVCQC